MNWMEEVEKYKKQHGDSFNKNRIEEWVDSLLPHTLEDILNYDLWKYGGLEYAVPEEMGYPNTIGDVMLYHIFEEYYEEFMYAWEDSG